MSTETATAEAPKRGNPAFMKKQAATKNRDFGIKIEADKTYEFETIVKSIAHRTQSLAGECKIYDKVEGRIREIRYIPQADSVFKDEQDEAYTSADAVTLYFNRDKLYINGTDTRGVEYCLLHDQYDGTDQATRLNKKGAFFTLVDKFKYEGDLDKALKAETLALKIIEEKTNWELKPMARIIFNIMEESPMLMRNRLRELIKVPAKKGEADNSNANLVIKNVTNPGLLRKYDIQLAIDRGVIKLDNGVGLVVWGDTNNPIKELDPSHKPHQQLSDLVNFSMVEGGKAFYELLKSKVEVNDKE